jgi:hypothetical protein
MIKINPKVIIYSHQKPFHAKKILRFLMSDTASVINKVFSIPSFKNIILN